ncbi:universal stress protein [Actinomadura adrarensis]|uniref:Universal stress protein n=1 Tax=Actinomadura adrarensis TaxID=1819600 RepID=A0ABW3CKX4_9ACTN
MQNTTKALDEQSRHAFMVVVGEHHRNRGYEVHRFGSVSHGVVHHAHCPVAVTRPR